MLNSKCTQLENIFEDKEKEIQKLNKKNESLKKTYEKRLIEESNINLILNIGPVSSSDDHTELNEIKLIKDTTINSRHQEENNHSSKSINNKQEKYMAMTMAPSFDANGGNTNVLMTSRYNLLKKLNI